MQIDRRRWRRRSMDSAGGSRLTVDGDMRPCRVLDIAPGGARLYVGGPPTRNLEVRIDHPLAGSIYATRVWAAADAMGVIFDRPGQAGALLALAQARPARGREQSEVGLSDAADGSTARRIHPRAIAPSD